MEVETAAVETTPVETASTAPVESATPEPGADLEASEGQPQKTEQPDKVDRRQNPDALRKTLKWLRENGGEHSAQAQAIERILGETKSYKTVYPTVREGVASMFRRAE